MPQRKRGISMTAIRIGAVLGAIAWAMPGPAAATNLLVNPGFETGDFSGWAVGGVLPSGVALDGTSLGTFFYGEGSLKARSGAFAAYSISSTQNIISGTDQTFSLEQIVAVTPNTTYHAGYYVVN